MPARTEPRPPKDLMTPVVLDALSLVDALLVLGFTGSRAFVGSDTGDFATAKTTAIHRDIRPALDPPRYIHDFVSLSAAVTGLKASGWIP